MLPSTPSHHPSPISLHLSIFTSSSSTLTSSLFPLLPSLLSSSDKASLPPTPPPPLLVYVGRVYVLSPIITTSLPVLHPYSSRLFRNTCEGGGVLSSTLFYLSARFQYIFSLQHRLFFFLTPVLYLIHSSPLFLRPHTVISVIVSFIYSPPPQLFIHAIRYSVSSSSFSLTVFLALIHMVPPCLLLLPNVFFYPVQASAEGSVSASLHFKDSFSSSVTTLRACPPSPAVLLIPYHHHHFHFHSFVCFKMETNYLSLQIHKNNPRVQKPKHGVIYNYLLKKERKQKENYRAVHPVRPAFANKYCSF